MAGTLDFAFCGSRPLRISWLIVGMKPFTSFKLLYRGAKNAKNRGAFRPPGPRDATAMFKLFARSRNAAAPRARRPIAVRGIWVNGGDFQAGPGPPSGTTLCAESRS